MSLTNQSHSAYRLQLFDAGRKLVQQMSAAAGKQINMAVVMGSPGLYTVEFRPEGHGKPLYAAVKVKK